MHSKFTGLCSLAAVRRSTARGPKKKNPIAPNFSKTGRPIVAISVPFDTVRLAEQNPGILVTEIFLHNLNFLNY